MDWNDPYEVEDFILNQDEEALRWEFLSSVGEPVFSLEAFLGEDGLDDTEV